MDTRPRQYGPSLKDFSFLMIQWPGFQLLIEHPLVPLPAYLLFLRTLFFGRDGSLPFDMGKAVEHEDYAADGSEKEQNHSLKIEVSLEESPDRVSPARAAIRLYPVFNPVHAKAYDDGRAGKSVNDFFHS